MNKAQRDQAFEELIKDFCRRIGPDFETVRHNLQSAYPDWDLRTLAGNLMEFGRGQISEIDNPTEQDTSFIVAHMKSLRLDYPEAAMFHAYASGCILGLVISKQLDATMLIPAIELAAQAACQDFIPDDRRPAKKPNAVLDFTGETVWDTLKASPEKSK